MKIKTTKKDDGTEEHRVWMDQEEYRQFRGAAANRQQDLIVRLGARGGLRANEVTDVQASHIKEVQADVQGADEYVFLYVPRGKDTTGETGADDGKSRNAAIPKGLATDLTFYATQNNIAPDEPLFDVTTQTIRNRVKYVAENAAEITENRDYLKVSSHDLRRYYATNLLQNKGVSKDVVREIGGWGSDKALEPYVKDRTPESIVEELSDKDA